MNKLNETVRNGSFPKYLKLLTGLATRNDSAMLLETTLMKYVKLLYMRLLRNKYDKRSIILYVL